MVEDKLENRAIMQLLLEREGVKTAFERWGTDTMAQLRKFAPVDLILLDLNLPNNVTGYDVFTMIRAESQFAHVPVVAVSATDPAVAIPRARELGFAGFIAKPLDFELFPKQIISILQHERVWYTF